MERRHLAYELALLAVVCTLAIFLFPARTGPYPTVNGPATALRAMRAWTNLLAAITLILGTFSELILVRFSSLAHAVTASEPLDPLLRSALLRC